MIWITGGTSGLGYYAAKELSKNHKIGIIGRNSKKIQQIRSEFSGVFECDVENLHECEEFWDYIRREDLSCEVLICNVGSGKSVPLGNENFQEWQRVFSKNFYSTTNMIESARDYYINNPVRFICISSICGNEYIKGAPITYSVAKAALNHYVKIKSRDLAKFNSVICALSLGNINFPGSTWNTKSNDFIQELVENEVASGRLGTPEEVAKFLHFMIGATDFLQGKIFTFDGGQTRW